MRRVGSMYTGPGNGTPHMAFLQSYTSASNYVVFSLADSSTFALVSVDLGNPYALSLSPVISVTFNGILTDGSMVSTTFTTPLDGTTNFHTFLFGPEFGSGLASVEIPSPVWAMDNLIFVPEPSTVSLLVLGVLAFGWRASRNRRRPATITTCRD